jgi:hypothetical protein
MTQHPSRSPEDLAASWASPPGLGRCLAIGSGIGVVLAFALITVLSVLGGIESGAAIGFGLFVALWGGLGFGSMMGGVAYAMGLEATESAGQQPAATGATDVPDDPSQASGPLDDRQVA